jgi:hypothetical protein
MRIANELTIRGEPARLELLLARVEALLRDGWKRNREAEERLARRGALRPWEYCFTCTAQAGRPAAAFWVHARYPDEWYVSHVLSSERRKLTAEESHNLLAEFEREFLRPAAAELGVETKVVQHRLTLEHDLSAEAARRLRAFSTSASRTGLQRDDRHRWNAFLIRVHQDEALFDPVLLDEWLQQDGWPEDTRCQLVSEHEAARSLLLDYDEEARRR